MTIKEAINQLQKDTFVSIDENISLLKHESGIIIAFSPNDMVSIIDTNKIPSNHITVDVNPNNMTFEDEMKNGFSYRLAGSIIYNKFSLDNIIESGIFPSFNTLKKLSNSRPILIKTAQWGGFGGTGGVGGLGQGVGVGHPMSGAGVFDNPVARTQFDQVLDTIRKTGEENGWFTTIENRMEEHPLYGHQRNEKDGNLEKYRLTWKEREKEKKKNRLKRMLKNRETANNVIDQNSVANIKAAPIDPRHFVTVEEKLNSRRHQEPKGMRTNQHGPESQFTHFPRQVTAQTKFRNGLSSIFENDPETMSNTYAYPPWITGREGKNKLPWSMHGPVRQKHPVDIGEENELMFGGDYLGDMGNSKDKGYIGIDYLMDARGRNPGNIHPEVFTEDSLPAIVQQMRENLRITDQYSNEETTTEKKLEPQHRRTPTVNVDRINYDIHMTDDPYPYATKKFFMPSRFRLDHSNG